jgi:hypothetical protein
MVPTPDIKKCDSDLNLGLLQLASPVGHGRSRAMDR